MNETKCLECGTVTAREEAFYDLSLDIEQNCSLTACLRNFRCWAHMPAGCRASLTQVLRRSHHDAECLVAIFSTFIRVVSAN